MNGIRNITLLAAALLIALSVWSQPLQTTTDYRIKAYKKGDLTTTSLSNTIDMVQYFNLYVPNTFTPNGDQLNDTFGAVGGRLNSFSMLIFNKWGELLYETDDINAPWDGTCKGTPVQAGSYVYKIFAAGTEMGQVQKMGVVTLLLQ